jgi:hypothetical protein
MDQSLLKLCPACSITTAPIPVLEQSIQTMRFLEATMRRTRIGLRVSALIQMDVHGFAKSPGVSFSVYPFDKLQFMWLLR